MKKLSDALKHHAEGDLLPLEAARIIAEESDLTIAGIEDAALCSGILPARYARNRNTISIAEQLMLFQSRVAVAGCGGLGGYIIEELARLGVGHLIILDPDVYEEHNLNRQLHSDIDALGRSKVTVAAERVQKINPAVTILPLAEPFTMENGARQFAGVHVVADALDNIPVRRALAKVCTVLGIPLVHGSIAGWYGQVIVQMPGDTTMETLYRDASEQKGQETLLGNPSFTPAVVGSIQAAEICKLILGTGIPLRSRLLMIDLLYMKFDEVNLTE
jgi:molybdopterin/thiamine biosynthesis adenylyltransferase